MKLYDYYLFLFLVCPALLTGQDYAPFTLEDGVTWQEYSFLGAGDPPGSIGGTTISYAYLLDGDTLVNGMTYKQVFSREDWYYDRRTYSTGPDMFETIIIEENYDNPYVLVGGLRQDTAAKTVHFINWLTDEFVYEGRCWGIIPAVGEEQLLYDFSVEVGDMVQSATGLTTITDIGSLTLEDGTERRTYQLDGYDTPWVEGIGGAGLGLFAPWLYPPFESGCGFYCYREAGEVRFRGSGIGINPNNLNETCNALVISVDDMLELGDVKVVPNPVWDRFRLSLPTELEMAQVQLNVFNSMGQLVAEVQSYAANDFIETSGWAKGMYYLVLRIEGVEVLHTKLLKVGP